MNKKCVFIILMACILVLGACFSAWKGDEGTISISIGGGEAFGRAAGREAAAETADGADTDEEEGFVWPEADEVFHTITFSGGSGPGPNQSGIKGGETVLFSVAPGQWTITVEAFYVYKNEDTTEAQVIGPLAEGSRTVNIKPGPNGVIVIPMSLKVIKDEDYSNNGGDDEVGTLRWAIGVETTKPFVILIDLPDSKEIITLNSALPTIENKSVTIRTKNPVTIKRESANFIESFFTIGNKGTLTLGGADSAEIIIDGSTSNNAQAPLITIEGDKDSTFIMNEGVTLQNNTNLSGNGGGVAVLNGTFTMKGGTISGNTAAGTVGTAASEDGKGGGVYVGNDGIFRKTDGTIYGNDATTTPTTNNTAMNSNGDLNDLGGHAIFVTRNKNDNRSEDKYKNKKVDYALDSETEESWDDDD